ncbi:MAG: M13 family metallopeptidase [Coxiellaceae bacterium]|jgi:putative endopeptidase|nr:M13 family metallopeptidase [Coxiellaceae bacterium]
MIFFSKYLWLGFILGLAISSSSISYADTVKHSTIPDKREFPVNPEINPCVDFYQYACSRVIDSFQLREGRSHHTFSFNDASERLLDFKKTYFANLANKKSESKMEQEVKNYYLACMDQESRKKEEVAKVSETKQMLKEITTREKFIDMVAKNISNAAQLSFVTFYAKEPNLDRPEYNDLIFDTGLVSLPEKSYYENKELIRDLKRLIEQFFIAIGEKSPKRKAELVFNFEKGLARIYPTPPLVQERLNTRTRISRSELINKYPYLKLKNFLSRIPQHVVIRDIVGKDTMGYLNNKLHMVSLEELKSVFLYFQLQPIMDDAYPEFFDKKFAFAKKYLGGPNKRPDRQERCTRSTMNSFVKEVDYILLPKLFPNFPKKRFIKSIEKIGVSLLEQLEHNTWLDINTKKEAIRKVKNAKLALVSPNNMEEWDFNPHADYAVKTPLANYYKLAQLLIDKDLKELQGPVNTNRWNMGPLTVNANYIPNYNRFEFPVGILQYPFYDPHEPDEVNLGAIGAVIGHELGHAIDNHGNRFNADGVFKTWMTDKDKKAFKKKAQYLITQFNKIGHNGKFTLGENIGDLVGLTTAYKAAFPAGVNGNELKKKFFLQFARLYCGVEREGVTKMRLKTDPHALNPARVNEQMKHQQGFKEAYNCKPIDPMVIPDGEMVTIW